MYVIMILMILMMLTDQLCPSS